MREKITAVELEFWGDPNTPDYLIEEGILPEYTDEYETQTGTVRSYTIGKPGRLPDGREILNIIWDIEEYGSPTSVGYHKGWIIIREKVEV